MRCRRTVSVCTVLKHAKRGRFAYFALILTPMHGGLPPIRNKFGPLQVETRPRLTRQIPKLAKATSESGLKERLSVYQIALGVGTSGTFLFLRSISKSGQKMPSYT